MNKATASVCVPAIDQGAQAAGVGIRPNEEDAVIIDQVKPAPKAERAMPCSICGEAPTTWWIRGEIPVMRFCAPCITNETLGGVQVAKSLARLRRLDNTEGPWNEADAHAIVSFGYQIMQAKRAADRARRSAARSRA